MYSLRQSVPKIADKYSLFFFSVESALVDFSCIQADLSPLFVFSFGSVYCIFNYLESFKDLPTGTEKYSSQVKTSSIKIYVQRLLDHPVLSHKSTIVLTTVKRISVSD